MSISARIACAAQTLNEWVKKAKGQAPGAVIVTQEKSMHISLEKTRLDALKARAAHE